MFDHIKVCKKCGLCKVRHRVVVGKGNLKAKLLLIGEAPGRQENAGGDPFVGDAGKQLDGFLNIAGLSRDEIFIMNSLFCWPGENNPTPNEIVLNACFPNVLEVLEAVRPEYVMPLGNTALWTITGRQEITKNRGKFLKPREELTHLGFKVFPSFHPAAVLRDYKKKNDLLEDFAVLSSIVYPKKHNLEYILVDSKSVLNTMYNDMVNAPLCAVDVETTGLSLARDKIIGVSFSCDNDKGYYIPTLIRENEEKEAELVSYWDVLDERYVKRSIVELLENKELEKSGQNFTFDRKFIRKDFGCEVNSVCFDTMYAAHLIDENLKHGLGALSIKYQDLVGYKRKIQDELLVKEYKAQDFSRATLPTLVERGCGDTISTFRLTKDLYKDIAGTKLEDVMFGISMPMGDVVYTMERDGVRIDRDYVLTLQKDFTKYLKRIEKQIYKSAGKEFNIRSTQQMADVLYNTLKLPKLATTKTGQGSTNQKYLNKLFHKHAIISLLMKYRGVDKQLSTYINGVLERLSDDNILYPSFGITGTVTARLNSSDPNLQNISKGKVDDFDLGLEEYREKIRPMFIPHEGNLFIGFDFSQIEIRILAWYTQDPTLLGILKSGGDIHESTARSMFDTDSISSAQRRDAKTVNFGIFYGLSPRSLAERLGISERGAVSFINKYFLTYKQVRPWMRTVKNSVARRGYVETVFGRRRRFPNYKYAYKRGERAQMERMAINFMIQSTASDVVKFAEIRCLEQMPEAHQWVQVHDEIKFEVPEDKAELWLPKLKEIMEQPVEPIDVALPVDGGIESRWGVKYAKAA